MISTQTLIAATTLSITTVVISTAAYADPTPINLSTWTDESSHQFSNWQVSDDGSSVLQVVNGHPTFFVSPDEFIDTTITGTLRVEDTIDNDYIGFVFGYQSPLAANNDPVDDYNFLLFDWKKSGGDGRDEGFSLIRVNGLFPTVEDLTESFWQRQESAKFDIFATNYGEDKGWEAQTDHDFSLLYQTDRIKIDIDGETIFDISGEFESGHFGFYNNSQANVRYSSFTQEETPPEKVPEPPSMLSLALLGLAGLGKLATRKRKDT